MSDELIKQLIEIIKSTNNFVLSQAPDVARQIVTMGRIIEPVEFLFGLVLIFGSVYAFKYTDTQVKNNEWDEIAWVPFGIGCLCALIGGLITTTCQFECTIKAWFAPKLYLLEYLSHLVRK